MKIDVAELRRRVRYDPLTGKLYWQADPPKNHQVGDELPTRDNGNGYIYATFERRGYGVHRLAWAITYGYWPRAEIDHRDTDKTNNRLVNLREATRAQNQWNAPIDRRNTSGFKGASWHKDKGRWRAFIHQNGRHISLGYHDSPEEAHAAYLRAAVALRGDFARAA